MESFFKQTSRLITYWLRHKPEDAELIVDEFGWTSVDALLKALHLRNLNITLADLIRMSQCFDKVRWEIDATTNRIRATHGHSFPIVLTEKNETPPGTLYHGTASKNLSKIAEQGLLPLRRQFVHLSETLETAIDVGKRHGKPIIVEVNIEGLASQGWRFYKTGDNVWLTSAIPAKYLGFKPWFTVICGNGHGFEELKREIGNRTSHFLFAQLDNLKMVWKSSASDDILFQNQQTGECFMVHLTYTRKNQEIDGFPYIETYKSIEEWIEKGLWDDQQYFYDLK